MTPEQYEELAAEYFKSKGYEVKKTPASNDYGIDVIATKGKERLAIQAKMYGGSSRKVNHAMVLELVGSMKYAECTGAAIVTDGKILPDAKKVAVDVGVSIIELKAEDSITKGIAEETGDSRLGFDRIWREHVLPLAGETVLTTTGQKNKIVSVDWGGVKRITSKGNASEIPIEPFRFAIERLLEVGTVSRDEINQEFHKERCSSGVFAVLMQVPVFRLSEDGPATLTFDPDSV